VRVMVERMVVGIQVEMVMTETTGQLVTVGAHEVMVYSTVERMVEVDIEVPL
jgi:hypothetical protein